MSYELEYEFAIGTPVYIDRCHDLVGYVTAAQWRHLALVHYEVSWFSNGKSENALIEGWRLTRVPE
jgi:hypothetical protein